MTKTYNPISFPGSLIPRTLHGRMLSLMFLLLGALIGITWLMVSMMVSSILEEYIGRNALNVSKAVSLTTVVQDGLKNKKSSAKAKLFYEKFVDGKLHITDCRTAEMCKLVENASRDVQIAFANELSIICNKAGINVWNLIKLNNSN